MEKDSENGNETYDTPFLCDNCGMTGNIQCGLSDEVIDTPCPSCAEENVLMTNFRASKGYVVTNATFFDKKANREVFVFDPVRIRNDILSAFKLLTFDGKTYRLNRITNAYEDCGVWLKQRLSTTLGEHHRDKYISEVVSQIQIVTAINEYPTPDPMLIPFKNGIYDLKSGGFRDYTEHDYFFSHLPIKYFPNGTSPIIDEFLMTTIESDKERQWLIDWASFVFARKIFTAKMLLITGYGSNGKSIWADILKASLGDDLHTSLSLHELKDFGLEPLYNQRPYLNVSGELSNKRDLEQDVIKKLISGETVTLNRKNKSFVTFAPTTKFLALSNELPENLRDLSDGWCRRILPMSFDKQFVEDEDFRERVTAVNEVQTWVSTVIIPNLRGLLATRKITDALNPQDVRSFFNENMNSISAFCEERLELDFESRIEVNEFQTAYAAFCVEQKLKRSSNIALGKGVRKFFKVKAHLKWNEPSPVESVTMRAATGQESFTEAYRGIRFKTY